MKRITQVRKRDGRVAPFDLRRVADAIYRAARSVGGEDRFLAEELAGVVGLYLEKSHGGRIPAVADVEDAVERVLIDTGHAKTAKAFILHRDRRRTARDRLDAAESAAPGGARPIVGSGSGGVAAWSKARIVAALVEGGRVDEATAEDVARSVEARVFSSGVVRVSTALLRTLVDAELFDRGRTPLSEARTVVGIATADLAARIAEGPGDRRTTDPLSFAEALGEEILAPYVLAEVIPPAAAEAHRSGDLHLEDLGAPFAVRHVALALCDALARTLRGDGVARALGARRAAAAVGEIVVRHAASASRTFALEDWNVHLAPHVDRLDEDALLAEAREWLLSPAILSFPRRGGLLRLEAVLTSGVPERLAAREAPAPAPPGRTLGDFDDAALRTSRAILAAAADLRREGLGDRLPDLTVVVPRRSLREPAIRALVRDALAGALDGGEPVLVFDDAGLPGRGPRARRVRDDEMGDPFRYADGDVAVATHACVNAAGAAWRAGAGDVEACLREVDRLVDLALDAARARRRFLERGGESPDGSLWAVRRGLVPLLDVEGAVHVVEPVGFEAAAAHLAGADPAARAGLVERILARVEAKAAEGAREKDLRVVVRYGESVQAPIRFATADAGRYPAALVAAAQAGDRATYAPARARAAGDAPVESREALGPPRAGRRASERLRIAVDGDRRPPLDRLVAIVERAAGDESVAEAVVDPWPRRVRRAEA